jgi:hypothetical protein
MRRRIAISSITAAADCIGVTALDGAIVNAAAAAEN